MERTITASEANQRFSELLRRVQSGDSFVVLSRGRPVARIAAVDADAETRAARAKAMLDYVKSLPRSQAYGWKREDLYE